MKVEEKTILVEFTADEARRMQVILSDFRSRARAGRFAHFVIPEPKEYVMLCDQLWEDLNDQLCAKELVT